VGLASVRRSFRVGTHHDRPMKHAIFGTVTASFGGEIGEIVLTERTLSPGVLVGIARACAWLEELRPKVIKLSGSGTSFSYGFDIAILGEADAADEAIQMADLGRRAVEALERVSAITVVVIRGRCVGGGLVLASACDIRIAEEQSLFSLPELVIGIPLAWGAIPRLVAQVGPVRCREMVISGRTFTAAQLESWGFLSHVVKSPDLVGVIDSLVQRVCALPRLALESTKQAVNAATASMVNPSTAWSDASVLAASFHDKETRQRMLHYKTQLGSQQASRSAHRAARL
jgi:enoyl-CoA hydratase/carnithine racemase